MPERDDRLPHLLVLGRVESEGFRRQGGGSSEPREVDRRAHGERLRVELDETLHQQDMQREQSGLEELRAQGVVITIESATRYLLKIDALERRSRHTKTPKRPKWLLLSVVPATDESPERAQVWVSDDYRGEFLRVFENFLERDTPTGKPRNRELVANIARIRATTLRDLWQSANEPPTSGEHWWEIWLRPDDDAIEKAQRFAESAGLRIVPSVLRLGIRHVVWLRARWDDLLVLPFTSVPTAELRRSTRSLAAPTSAARQAESSCSAHHKLMPRASSSSQRATSKRMRATTGVTVISLQGCTITRETLCRSGTGSPHLRNETT